jgi:hypothetical protein
LHEIVKLADGRSEASAHPRKVLFDAYHATFEQYGFDTSKDKACLRVLLSLAGPHVPGTTLMEKFKVVIQQAGFELEYVNDDLHIDQIAEVGIGEQTMAESEAIVRSLQQQHARRLKQQPAVAELEDPTQEQSLRPRNSRSVPDFGRGSQLSGDSQSNLAAMPYSVERPDPYSLPHTNNFRATQMGTVTDSQTEDVVFPEADQAAIQDFMRRMTDMEDLAISKDSRQLKADSFRIWRTSAREKKAADFHRRKLLARVTSQFASRQHDDYTADAMYRETLAKRSKETLEAWRAEARLRPAEQRVSYQHDLKLAQESISKFRTLVRLPGHAEAVREKALKRKGFDGWGENLRVRAMEQKIDYRLMISSIYQWTIATRASILRRQNDQRQLRRALNALVAHHRAQQDRLRAAEVTFVASKKARRSIRAFVAMSSKLDQQRRHEQMADQFYHPKIEFENLLLWKDRLSEVQRLNLRADDAREYFLSVKFLRIWKVRTKEIKEQRLNQAYKQVRRKGKIRIVRAGLDTWCSEYKRLQVLGGMSEDFVSQREHRLLRKQFVRWRNKTSQVVELEFQAGAHFQTKLLGRSVPALVAKSQAIKVLGQRADEFHAIHTADNASKQLRKLKGKAFELRRRQQDADAMRDRHEQSHYRSMLRLWARKSTGKAPHSNGLDNPEDEADRIMDDSLLPDIEDDETALPGPNTHKKRTPVPEYLHTPSNRAARVRKLATATSTTPASAPSSFAARLLAGGISMTPKGKPPTRLNESMMG